MSRRKTILIVDDDRSFNALLSSQIAEMGYEAVSACSWSEAQECLKVFEPHLVLLDMKLPDVNSDVAVAEL